MNGLRWAGDRNGDRNLGRNGHRNGTGKRLRLSARLNSAAIPASEGPRLLYALVEMHVDAQFLPQRAPVALTVLVDCSDSMRVPTLSDEIVGDLARRELAESIVVDGVPAFRLLRLPDEVAPLVEPANSLDTVEHALEHLARGLGDEDRLTVIAFAGEAARIFDGPGGAEIPSLRHSGDANGDGLLAGLGGDTTRIGPALRLALDGFEASPDDGRVRRALLLTDGFAADEVQAMFAAEQLARIGVPLSTAGLGLAFNEAFLITLAETTGGKAHFVYSLADVTGAFASELESTLSVALRGVELKLALAPGITLRRAYRVRPLVSELNVSPNQASPHAADSLCAMLGDLERDETISVLLEIVVPPGRRGDVPLFEAAASGMVPGLRGEREIERVRVRVRATDDAVPPPDAAIMRLVEMVQTFKLQTRALHDLAAGDVGGATIKLKAASTRLLSLGETERAHAVENEIAHLTATGQLSAAGAKQLRYEAGKLTQKLG